MNMAAQLMLNRSYRIRRRWKLMKAKTLFQNECALQWFSYLFIEGLYPNQSTAQGHLKAFGRFRFANGKQLTPLVMINICLVSRWLSVVTFLPGFCGVVVFNGELETIQSRTIRYPRSCVVKRRVKLDDVHSFEFVSIVRLTFSLKPISQDWPRLIRDC